MRSSKQNKDQDLIFEAYTSRVYPSKFDAVVDEAVGKSLKKVHQRLLKAILLKVQQERLVKK